MLLIGLTGGIGAGKSTVAGLLAGRGAVIVDADTIAREVVEPGTPAYQQLVARFGANIVDGDSSRLNRPALAARVFGDPAALADLNAITHPAIRAAMVSAAAAHVGSDRVVVLDIPLLKPPMRDEFGLAGVVVVDAPVEVAVERLVQQRGLSESDARARIAAQISRQDRLRMADVVIDNAGPRSDLEAAGQRVWEWIEGLRSPAFSDGSGVGGSGPAQP